MLLTDGDEDKSQAEVVANGVEADCSLGNRCLVDLLIHSFPLGVHEEPSHDYDPDPRDKGRDRPAYELLGLHIFICNKLYDKSWIGFIAYVSTHHQVPCYHDKHEPRHS